MPHFIPEIVYLITQFLDTRDKNAASQVCRTFRENIHWTRDEYLGHLCDATARGLTSLRDSILDRYPICPQVLKTVIKAGCPVTVERVLAELNIKNNEESYCPLDLLESCDLTYALWANIPGTREHIKNQYNKLDAAWAYEPPHPRDEDSWLEHNEDSWSNYYEYHELPGEGTYRHPRGERDFYSCYVDTFDRIKYVLLRNLGNEHSQLLAEVRSRQTAIVKLLLATGAEPSDQLLHLAGRDGFFAIFRLLLEDGRADPSWCHHSVLLEACKNGLVGVIRLLSRDSRTPSYQMYPGLYHDLYHIARREKHTDVMILLLTEGAIPQPTALQFSMHKTSLVRMLIENYHFSVTADTVSYALQFAKLPVVQELLRHFKPSENSPFRFNARDLEHACCNRDVRVVRMVLAAEWEWDAHSIHEVFKAWNSTNFAKMCLLENPSTAATFVLNDELHQFFLDQCSYEHVEVVKTLLRHPHFADIRLCDGPEPRNLIYSEHHNPCLSDIMQMPYWSKTLSTALYELHTPTCVSPEEHRTLRYH